MRNHQNNARYYQSNINQYSSNNNNYNRNMNNNGKARYCQFYGSMIGCRQGNNCRWSHDNPNSVPFCTYSHNCKWGNQCWFRHTHFKQSNHNYTNPLQRSQSQSTLNHSNNNNANTNHYRSNTSTPTHSSVKSSPLNSSPINSSSMSQNSRPPCNGNVAQCEYTKKIIQCLKFYHSLSLEHNKTDRYKFLTYVKNIYVSLLDDYIHLITKHSGETELSHIFRVVRHEFNMRTCDFVKCHFAMLHHRNRSNDIPIKPRNNNNLDQQFLFFVDTMDSIHCYFYHLYDIGLRVKKTYSNSVKNKSDKNKNDNFDSEFANIQKTVATKRKLLNNLRQFDFSRYNNDKFSLNSHAEAKDSTFMDGLYKYIREQGFHERDMQSFFTRLSDEEIDSDALQYDMSFNNDTRLSNIGLFCRWNKIYSEDIQHYIYQTKLSVHSFGIGFRFYYWPYYRNNEEETKDNTTNHYTPSQLYISPKYKSLKAEIIYNNIYRLEIHQMNVSITKANQFIKTVKAKQSVANLQISDFYKYGIKNGTAISYEHLLSVILYTDWDRLSSHFAQTFRKVKCYDTISMVKKRNEEFANWAKLIRECVEYFGNKGWEEWESNTANAAHNHEKGPFFCRTSYVMTIPQFNLRLNAPTSTTKSFCVATRFSAYSNAGMIIELNNNAYFNSALLRSFNCAWLSNYTGEDERLWCGGLQQIKVENVRILKGALNYSQYFRPCFYFDSMLSGTDMRAEMPISDSEYLMIYTLINDALGINGFDGKYPKYIYQTFEGFTNNKTEIIINLDDVVSEYKIFADLIWYTILNDSEAKYTNADDYNERNLFKPKIFALFKNVKSIVINTTGFRGDTYMSYSIDILALLSLLDQISSLNNHKYVRITLKAEHEYAIQYDRLSNAVTKQSYVGVSWLGRLWDKLVKTKFTRNEYNISFKTALPKSAVGEVKTDVLIVETKKNFVVCCVENLVRPYFF